MVLYFLDIFISKVDIFTGRKIVANTIFKVTTFMGRKRVAGFTFKTTTSMAPMKNCLGWKTESIASLFAPLAHKPPQVPLLPPPLRLGRRGSQGLRPVDFVDKLMDVAGGVL